MDQERNDYELPIKGTNSHDMAFGNLTKTIQEQTSTIEKQEKVLQDRDNEIKQLVDEIRQYMDMCSQYQQKERHSKLDTERLREERDSTQRMLRQYEAEQVSLSQQVQELQKNRDMGSAQYEEFQMLKEAHELTEENVRKLTVEVDRAKANQRARQSQQAELSRELQHTRDQLKQRNAEIVDLGEKEQAWVSQEQCLTAEHQREIKLFKQDNERLSLLVVQRENEKLETNLKVEELKQQHHDELQREQQRLDLMSSTIKEQQIQISVLQTKVLSNQTDQTLGHPKEQPEDKDVTTQVLASQVDQTVKTAHKQRKRNTSENSLTEEIATQITSKTAETTSLKPPSKRGGKSSRPTQPKSGNEDPSMRKINEAPDQKPDISGTSIPTSKRGRTPRGASRTQNKTDENADPSLAIEKPVPRKQNSKRGGKATKSTVAPKNSSQIDEPQLTGTQIEAKEKSNSAVSYRPASKRGRKSTGVAQTQRQPLKPTDNQHQPDPIKQETSEKTGTATASRTASKRGGKSRRVAQPEMTSLPAAGNDCPSSVSASEPATQTTGTRTLRSRRK